MSLASMRSRYSRSPVPGFVAAGLAVVMTTGCYSHSAVRNRVSPAFAAAELSAEPERERAIGIAGVVLDDGSEVTFVEPVTPGIDGVLRGTALVEAGDDRSVTRPVAIPWDSVQGIVLQWDERTLHWGKTVGLVLGIPALALVVALAVQPSPPTPTYGCFFCSP